MAGEHRSGVQPLRSYRHNMCSDPIPGTVTSKVPGTVLALGDWEEGKEQGGANHRCYRIPCGVTESY
jgi:hypothetical protein